MKYFRAAFLLGAFALVHGCAASQRQPLPLPAERGGAQFPTEEQRLLACLDLRDHIVDLYADQYVRGEGAGMTRAQRTAFRDGWAEELAKRGTFQRFEQSCFDGLTPHKYECGMQSQTPDGLATCMKLSLNELAVPTSP